jgi:hypothetical protein
VTKEVIMDKQELKALWEYAEFLERTEKGSRLYNQVKEVLLEAVKDELQPNL